MIYSSVVSLLIIIYFVKDQFEFSKVTKTRLLFLPIFCLYQFFSKLNINSVHDIVMLIVILIFSIVVGFYQSVNFKIKELSTSKYFFIDDNGKEVNIYQKALYARGGRSYLIGWLLVFLFTLLLNSKFNNDLNFFRFTHELVDEMMKDLSIFMRIKDKSSGWKSWGILGITNIAYLFFIRHKSIKMNQFFKPDAMETTGPQK
ncbi:hypothetical protein [Lentilactobacillus hilgardii]|uniref:Hydrophobic protein n=1 Tax=Lentilactobacillus hilgardii (strain ATCC 8290 / DSM 20176 / CCUG 30140 / JCM 1155 / KCTC 3500 / NBRC 15886 / NCIMB 8040 / NRRL B-1843 / 9) TaxID=1423757 RepID=C0XHY7_LENH9|nr:hypothetical protein [Lentilactobacillus hilgardii]EEI24999.1 hypothetical protein HMPREF0519_0848 [Lentilactobacillus hilgardii DSM 20176 = ATCC 8290]KRK53671.1 hypothetical protein FD42_GL001829 [Lentilactobacillus hilgardii DSM 20176 = ATCC 8290]QEU39543.1 hypothetical protein LH500_12075 [Lentilactobacillus hilgardii]TDG79755.1 hypothetical protein C5L34_000525 [Lentilactobacillus hilgardii]